MSETGHDAEEARPTVLLLRPNYGDVENPVRAHALTPTGTQAACATGGTHSRTYGALSNATAEAHEIQGGGGGGAMKTQWPPAWVAVNLRGAEDPAELESDETDRPDRKRPASTGPNQNFAG